MDSTLGVREALSLLPLTQNNYRVCQLFSEFLVFGAVLKLCTLKYLAWVKGVTQR